MSETSDTAGSRPHRPLIAIGLLLIGVLFLFHAFGASMAVTIIVVVVLAAVGLVVLRFLPHLRKHFNAGRARRSSRRATRSSSRTTRSRMPRMPRRSSGLRAGGARSRRSAASRGRTRPPGGSSSRRRFMPGAGAGRRLARSPARRAGGGSTRANRRGGRSSGSSRRRLMRPGTGRPGGARSRTRGPAGSTRRRLLPTRRNRGNGAAPRPNGVRRPAGAKSPPRRRFVPWKPSTWRPKPNGRPGAIRRLTHRPNGQTRRGPIGAVARRMQTRRARRAARATGPLPQPSRWRRLRARWRPLRRLRRAVRRPNRAPGAAIPVPAPLPHQTIKPAEPAGAAPNRPAPPPVVFTPPPSRGTDMSHPAIEPINDAVQEKLAPYEPQGPLEWLSFMQSLPEMFENFRTSLSGLGDKLASDFPMNPEVADRWQDMVAAMSGLDEHAQDMAAKFEQDPRVQRALNPQPREDVMDVQND